MSKFRGYEIEWKNGQFVFTDTGQPTITTWKQRPCGYCGKHNTKEGYDGCVGYLKGVINACCGHGQTNEAYIQFPDYTVISGEEALNKMREIKQPPSQSHRQ